jgi:hypothetical protein
MTEPQGVTISNSNMVRGVDVVVGSTPRLLAESYSRTWCMTGLGRQFAVRDRDDATAWRSWLRGRSEKTCHSRAECKR